MGPSFLVSVMMQSWIVLTTSWR